MALHQCPFCGKMILDTVEVCPHCREAMPETRPANVDWGSVGGAPEIRRGLLYMLLAAVFYYFTSSYSPFEITFSMLPVVTDYLLPLLFLSGVGLTAYGLYRNFAG